MFENFDFSLLESPDFKEDSVREEIIVPILTRLGYSASPPNQIRRSIALRHPFITIGSSRKPVTLVPDYLLVQNGKNHFVLDAKAPSEEISSGRHVEQAYSYAIHPEVRTPYFALCNGRSFSVFDFFHIKPILSFDVKDIDSNWRELASILAIDPVRVEATFFADLGVALLRMGFGVDQKGKKIHQIFATVDIGHVTRIDETHYTLQSVFYFDETPFYGSFDFRKELLSDFYESVFPKTLQNSIKHGLEANPFSWTPEPNGLAITGFSCVIADHIYKNENESYLPFQIDTFVPMPAE